MLCVSLVLPLAIACETGAPPMTDAGGRADGGPGDAGELPDAQPIDAAVDDAGEADGGAPCAPAPDDYTPRVTMSSTDTWPECVSDDGTYHLIDAAGLSSQARVAAFEAIFTEMGATGMPGPLFYDGRDPSAADFTAARTTYAQPSGLGSRVNRRTDDHYASVSGTCTSGATMLSGCQCPDVAAANPEYCVGPGTLLPIITREFRAGQTGSEPARVHAARIHAALLWFLYISPYKESLTCTRGSSAKDCDSAWAYYTGQDATTADDRSAGIGLATILAELAPETHDRIWDGLLAVRCWRDLDRGTPAAGEAFGDATMLELRDRARTQMDRALLHGMAAITIDRLQRLAGATGAERAALLAFLQTLLRPIDATTIEVIDETTGTVTATYEVPARPSLFDRALREASPADADLVAGQMSMAEPADVAAVIAAIERALPCP